MLEVAEEIHILESNLKCVSDDGEWGGGDCKYIKNTHTGERIELTSVVKSMKSFKDCVLFGMADGRLGVLSSDGAVKYLTLHTKDICAIDCCGDSILTGSWDHSATLLTPIPSTGESKTMLDGQGYAKKQFKHPGTIWKVVFIDETTFLTGCTDGAIRLFKDGQLVKTMRVHANVVRGLRVEEEIIYSVDNYGKMLKLNMDGKILKSRNLDEVCFDLCLYGKLVLVCGEGGKIFAANRDLQVLFEKRVPGFDTCWSIREINDLLFVTGDKGQGSYLAADEKAIAELEERGNMAQKMEEAVSGSESPKPATPKPGYDNTFSVELNNKIYKIQFNNDEAVHEVASKFLHENSLSPVYYQEIVDYINANFKANQFKKYKNIYLEGILKAIKKDNHPIVDVLRDIQTGAVYSILMSDEKNVYQIEKILFSPDDLPLFVVFDVCKYLYFKKIWVDLSFLFQATIREDKEARALVLLLTNMVEDPPFDLSKLDHMIRGMIDRRQLNHGDIAFYEENRHLKKSMCPQ